MSKLNKPKKFLNINGQSLCFVEQFGRHAFYLPADLARGKFAGRLWWTRRDKRKHLSSTYLSLRKPKSIPHRRHVRMVFDCFDCKMRYNVISLMMHGDLCDPSSSPKPFSLFKNVRLTLFRILGTMDRGIVDDVVRQLNVPDEMKFLLFADQMMVYEVTT